MEDWSQPESAFWLSWTYYREESGEGGKKGFFLCVCVCVCVCVVSFNVKRKVLNFRPLFGRSDTYS